MRASTQPVEPLRGSARRKVLKTDPPRSTDAHIDYFGGRPAGDLSPEKDLCGERFLDIFAGQGGAP